MSIWKTIEKSGDVVTLEGGTPFSVGQKISMGLGSIELRNTPKAGLHVVRFSGSGHFTYSIRLTRDGQYRLGSGRGHRVVPSKEEADPIKRILRELDIPVSILERTDVAVLEVDERWYDNQCCPNGRNTHNWVTDNYRGKSMISSEVLEEAHGCFSGGGRCSITIEGVTYAIRVDSGRYMGGSSWHRPGKVVVWPNCDPAKLGDALAAAIYGEDADLGYLGAVKSLEAAREWFEGRYDYRPEGAVSSGGNLVSGVLDFRRKDGHMNFRVTEGENPDYSLGVLGKLYQKFGMPLFQGMYETKRAEFNHLFGDRVAAEAYLVEHFDLRLTPTGSYWNQTEAYRDRDMLFQVKRKGSEKWTGPSYEREDWYPSFVDILFKRHEGLKKRLFELVLSTAA